MYITRFKNGSIRVSPYQDENGQQGEPLDSLPDLSSESDAFEEGASISQVKNETSDIEKIVDAIIQ